MVLLMFCQECSLAEDLHPSQDERSQSAHRTSRTRKFDVWSLASWNVRTMLDAEGPS